MDRERRLPLGSMFMKFGIRPLTEKKRRAGDIAHVFTFDLENFELDDFEWAEDHEVPPIIKPKIIKKDGEDQPS